MDAIAPSTTAPALPPLPAPAREASPDLPPPRSAPPPTTPAPVLDAPPLPLSVQREALQPPPAPLMSGEQMAALLNAALHGMVRPHGTST